MTRDENLDRLRAATSGRVAVSLRALPYVFLAPIHLVEHGDEDPTLVVTFDPATTNAHTLDHAVVAVHTDGIDSSGVHWEVLVQGLSTCATTDGVAQPESSQASVGAHLIRGWHTSPD